MTHSDLDTTAFATFVGPTVADYPDSVQYKDLQPYEAESYKQRLRPAPEPKRLHTVDREAIMAVLQGLSDEDSGSMAEDAIDDSKSVTDTDSDERMGSEAAVMEAMEVDRVSGDDTWSGTDTVCDVSTTVSSEEIS
jgi:hypothetical protein